MADAAGLIGTFKAWLSDRNGSPDQDFVKSGGPFVTTNGTKVADNWLDLVDSNLDNPITFDENGIQLQGSIFDFSVWTGTAVAGLPDSNGGGDFCDDWTSNTGSYERTDRARTGDSSAITQGWTYSGDTSCDNARRLYCFEQ